MPEKWFIASMDGGGRVESGTETEDAQERPCTTTPAYAGMTIDTVTGQTLASDAAINHQSPIRRPQVSL